MKFTNRVPCRTCGAVYTVTGYGEKDFPPVLCQKCKAAIFLNDLPSVSKIAERLLLRSQAEIDGNDPTVSIICSGAAVEAAFTHVYMKWKEIDNKIGQPTDEQRDQWESGYRKGTGGGGFEKSANFVSKQLTGKKFDVFVSDFIKKNGIVSLVGFETPPQESELKADYVNEKLFRKRNRILHWGEVNLEKEDALSALMSARYAITVLEFMEKERGEAFRMEFNLASNSPA